jgi:hypothetical protein
MTIPQPSAFLALIQDISTQQMRNMRQSEWGRAEAVGGPGARVPANG